MPATASYPTPIQQLGILGRAAYGQGVPFDTFWMQAVEPCAPDCRQCYQGGVGRHTKVRVIPSTPPERRPACPCIVWPSDRGEAAAWRHALKTTRAAWERAYYGRPATQAEQAVVLLVPVMGRIGDAGIPEALAA